MEIGVVGDDMFTIGFRLVGIEKWFTVNDDNTVDSAIKKALEDKDLGILVIHDKDWNHLETTLTARVLIFRTELSLHQITSMRGLLAHTPTTSPIGPNISARYLFTEDCAESCVTIMPISIMSLYYQGSSLLSRKKKE